MKLLLSIFLLLNFCTYAQIIKDTSFSIQGSFIKEKKRYPAIEIPGVTLPAGVLVQKDVVYGIVGGRELFADVYYPAKKKRNGYPAVLLIFGGGWKSGNKNHWVSYAHRLAENGFVAVAAEYRLSPEAQYPAAVYDLKAAVRWMRANAKKYSINKKEIAALGASAGGQLASLLGTTNGNNKFEGIGGNASFSSAVQAVINIDGVLAFKHPESTEGTVAAEWLGGTSKEKPAVWAEASALTHVDRRSVPVSFINSSNPRFHAGRTDMIRQLDSFKIYSEVHEFPTTPHTFWLFHPWFEDVIKHTITFLNRQFN